MSEFFPDNQTANRHELLTFINAVVADFIGTRTKRDTTTFVADDGDLVEVELSPVEEFVVNAALYGVQCALLMLSDGSGRNLFADKGAGRLRADDE